VSLGAFFSFLGEVSRIGSGDYGTLRALEFVLLSMPLQAWEVFPVAALIGTLLALGNLAAGSELVAMRASGMSLLRIGRSAAIGAAAMAVICLLLGDLIAPPAEQYAQSRRSLAVNCELASAEGQGVWARDGRTYVNVRQLSDARTVDGIWFYEFDEDGQLRRTAQAAAARFDADGWSLEGVQETHILDDGQARTAYHSTLRWNTRLSPDVLNLFVVDPGSLSVFGLRDYVDYLQENELDASRYQHAFWSKLVAPGSVIGMVLLALPFVAGHARSTTASQRLLVGLLIGVAFFLVNRVLGFSGEVFRLDPVVVAWLPTAVLASAAVLALARMR